jgi:Cell wall-active antibiotics response 4TMS YvqF
MIAEKRRTNQPRVFAIVLITLGVIMLVYFIGGGWFGSRTITTEQIEQGLEGSSRATVTISSSVSELRVTGLNDANNLIAGKIDLIAGEKATKQFKQSGDTASYELRSEWPNNRFTQQSHLWDLGLSTRVPLNLTVQAGVGQTTLDLQTMQLESLNVITGVGTLDVTLSDQGRYAATLETSVGSSTVTIPKGLAARITLKRGLGQVNVTGTFKQDGDTYVSPDYETAESRVDLTIQGGVGTITIRANE